MSSPKPKPPTTTRAASAGPVRRRTLSPEAYADQLQKIELRSVLLESLESRVNWAAMPDPGAGIPYTFGIEPEVMPYVPDNRAQPVGCDFTLTSKKGPSIFVQIKARYRLEFGSPESFTPGFFHIFGASSIPGIVWPYLRELSANVVARMGLPPLVLPALVTVPAPGQSPAPEKPRKPRRSAARGKPAKKK